MTLISAISNIGSVKGSSSSLKQINSGSSLSFNSNHAANAPQHQHDDATHLVDLGVLANVLGIIGLGVKAKVL